MKSKSAMLLIAAIILCAPAFATKPPHPAHAAPVTNNNASAQAGASAAATGTANSNQHQEAVAQQSQTSVTNQYDQDTTTVEDVRELAIAPAAIAPNIYPSAVCYTGSSAGVSFGNSGFGAGLSGGKAKLDPECEMRELARSFATIGNLEAANAVLCNTAAALRVFGDKCPGLGNVTRTEFQAFNDYVTRDELKARDKKLLKAATSK